MSDVAVIAAALSSGPLTAWVVHLLAIRRDGLIKVKQKCGEAEVRVQSLEKDLESIQILEDDNLTLSADLAAAQVSGERFLGQCMQKYPDVGWEELGWSVGFPPPKRLSRSGLHG